MKQQATEWRGRVRKETRGVDRQIREITREMNKIEAQIKQHARLNEMDAARILACEVVRTRKAIEKLHMTKTQLNSVGLSIQQSMATMRVAGHLAKSGEVMEHMNSLIKLPEIRQSMQDMSKEMAKMGFIEEMAADTIDDAFAVEDEEELVDSEVAKIMQEVAGVDLGFVSTEGLKAPETVVEDTTTDLAARAAAL